MKFKAITSIGILLTATILSSNPVFAANCTPTQPLTEGPYYSTDTPVRSDVTASQPGTKTKLTITVVDSSCNIVKGAKVDIWHANASGKYSAVDGNSQNFLRGTQITDSNGKVTFTTIYPGWYPGRTMHIHFKVWVDGKVVLTSQFFASDANNKKIYQSGVYAKRGNQDVSLQRDRIYRELVSPAALTLKLKIASTITASAKVAI